MWQPAHLLHADFARALMSAGAQRPRMAKLFSMCMTRLSLSASASSACRQTSYAVLAMTTIPTSCRRIVDDFDGTSAHLQNPHNRDKFGSEHRMLLSRQRA